MTTDTPDVSDEVPVCRCGSATPHPPIWTNECLVPLMRGDRDQSNAALASDVERHGEGSSRMTRLAPWLWLDLGDVVSVKLVDGKSYNRYVVIGLRNGVEHRITVHTNPTGRLTVGQGNTAVDAWLREHLGEFLALADPSAATGEGAAEHA